MGTFLWLCSGFTLIGRRFNTHARVRMPSCNRGVRCTHTRIENSTDVAKTRWIQLSVCVHSVAHISASKSRLPPFCNAFIDSWGEGGGLLSMNRRDWKGGTELRRLWKIGSLGGLFADPETSSLDVMTQFVIAAEDERNHVRWSLWNCPISFSLKAAAPIPLLFVFCRRFGLLCPSPEPGLD